MVTNSSLPIACVLSDYITMEGTWLKIYRDGSKFGILTNAAWHIIMCIIFKNFYTFSAELISEKYSSS